MEGITKEEIQKFEDCRKSGVCNMIMDWPLVSKITGLCQEKLFFIMSANHYSELIKKYNIKRK